MEVCTDTIDTSHVDAYMRDIILVLMYVCTYSVCVSNYSEVQDFMSV